MTPVQYALRFLALSTLLVGCGPILRSHDRGVFHDGASIRRVAERRTVADLELGFTLRDNPQGGVRLRVDIGNAGSGTPRLDLSRLTISCADDDRAPVALYIFDPRHVVASRTVAPFAEGAEVLSISRASDHYQRPPFPCRFSVHLDGVTDGEIAPIDLPGADFESHSLADRPPTQIELDARTPERAR